MWMKHLLLRSFVCLLVIGSIGCAKSAVQSTSSLVRSPSGVQPKPSQILTGKASWYGHRFHGRTTANGEKYNMYAMTAAHKNLPFGSHLLVINPQTGRSLIVRVNDRGPYIPGRILDLSYAAALELGMAEKGVETVWIAVYPPEGKQIEPLARRVARR